jgi:hypothetical protein
MSPCESWRGACRPQPAPPNSAIGYEKVRPTGFEPVTLGSEDCRADDATLQLRSELRQSLQAEVPTMVPRPPEGALTAVSASDLPRDLARIAATWDRLPEAIKVGLLALVEAAVGGDG